MNEARQLAIAWWAHTSASGVGGQTPEAKLEDEVQLEWAGPSFRDLPEHDTGIHMYEQSLSTLASRSEPLEKTDETLHICESIVCFTLRIGTRTFQPN